MTSPLLLCARQERILAVRSRWTQIFAVVFAALSLAVAGSGYILTGGSGLQDFSRTAVSLVQRVLVVVPLTSLLIGVMALVPDRGAAELLYSQPVGRGTILLGRLLGLFEALVAAQAIGFAAAGLVIFARTGEEGIAGFVLVFLGSVLTTAVFLGIAALLSAGARAAGGRAPWRWPSWRGSPSSCCSTWRLSDWRRCFLRARRRGCSSSA